MGSTGDVLVISNYEPGDVTFDSDRGSWNVTRAIRDCMAGEHKAYTFDIADAVEANINVEVDEDKIADMVASPTIGNAPPLIFVVEDKSRDGRPMLWLIDGHHRLRALQRLNFTHCAGWVIEEERAARYRLFYNGRRYAPWIPAKSPP
jgi:hypothetical protein